MAKKKTTEKAFLQGEIDGMNDAIKAADPNQTVAHLHSIYTTTMNLWRRGFRLPSGGLMRRHSSASEIWDAQTIRGLTLRLIQAAKNIKALNGDMDDVIEPIMKSISSLRKDASNSKKMSPDRFRKNLQRIEKNLLTAGKRLQRKAKVKVKPFK